MGFRGLFIGIDRYRSADISELSFARRDAVALEALFSDTLGGATVLQAERLIRRCVALNPLLAPVRQLTFLSTGFCVNLMFFDRLTAEVV